MSKNPKLIAVASILAVCLIAIGIFVYSQRSNQNSSNDQNYGSTKTTQIEVPSSSSSTTLATVESTSSTANLSASNTSSTSSSVSTVKVNLESGYANYSIEKLGNAKYGKVVLFFHASWCPSCKALDSDIKSNLANIPNDLLILKVDYDNSRELKQKYNVTSQHTLVQVDESGNMIKSSAGLYQLNTLESVVKSF